MGENHLFLKRAKERANPFLKKEKNKKMIPSKSSSCGYSLWVISNDGSKSERAHFRILR